MIAGIQCFGSSSDGERPHMHPDDIRTKTRNLRTGLTLAGIAFAFLLAFVLRRYIQ